MGKTYTGIGLMSGTSADGIDVALVEIDPEASFLVQVLTFERIDFQPHLKKQILASFNEYTAKELCQLNFILGEELAKAVNLVKAKANCPIDFVASHGQTIYHIPPGTQQIPSTLQLGEPCVIAERTGLTVLADFRTRDMAAGGQGAPLVPLADYLLFGNLDGVITQNIGGIANLTFIPSDLEQEKIIAFDTGPGNMVIDEVVRTISLGKKEFDKDGELASLGRVSRDYLEDLLKLRYFRLEPPKTTGRELFGKEYTKEFITRGRKIGLLDNDLVATATALTVESIARAYEKEILPNNKVKYVILGGGGSYNLTLKKWLQERLPQLKIVTHEYFGLSSDAKEAVAFAILGWRTLLNQTGNIASATGAKHNVVLGKIIPGDNWTQLLRKIAI